MSEIAERHTLGWVLHNFSYMGDLNRITPEMYRNPIRRAVFTELRQTYDRGKDFSLAQLEMKMRDSKEVSDEVVACMESVISVATIQPDIEVMIETYRANMLYKITTLDLKIDPAKASEQVAETINKLEALMDSKTVECESAADMVKHYKGDYFKEHEEILVGFKHIDGHLVTLDRGDVTVLGARPAVGKSALALQICKNLVGQGLKVGLFNLEMKNKQIYERLIASYSAIGLQRIRRAKSPTGDEEKLFDQANEKLASLDKLMITSGTKSVADIRRECRYMNYDVVVIDYLQLLRTGTTYKGNRAAEVGEVSKALKDMAMELNVHVILLSQLNRGVKEDQEPTMAELRESGDIEQDASNIILLWKMSDRKHRGWKVDKCRNGTTGEGAFDFKGDQMLFVEDDGFRPPKLKTKDNDCPFVGEEKDEDNG